MASSSIRFGPFGRFYRPDISNEYIETIYRDDTSVNQLDRRPVSSSEGERAGAWRPLRRLGRLLRHGFRWSSCEHGPHPPTPHRDQRTHQPQPAAAATERVPP